MTEFPKEEFKRDFIIKTLVQQTQFEQWLQYLFYLNNELTKEYDFVHQDSFYVKFYDAITEGLIYAKKVLKTLEGGSNKEKYSFFINLISGLDDLKSTLDESELDYIEYRRHSASHIFQNQYENIQDDLRIKKERKSKNVQELNSQLQQLLIKHGSDKNIDHYLNQKIQPQLKSLYQLLNK